MTAYVWPILVVIAANTLYNICARSTPSGVQPFASLTITYLAATIITLILFFVTSENKNLFSEMGKTNWSAFVFGLSIVALEFGYIYVYRNGWDISIGSLVANIGLACVLVVLGITVYKEALSFNQVIGIVFCIVGMVFINK